MTFTTDLAAFIIEAQASDLPQRDRDILRRHTLDTVVTRLAGGRTSEGDELLRVFPGESLPEAIALSGGLVRLTEMDDIHIASTTTPSSVTVPVALALGARTSCDPARIESAIYVATELVVRFGKAMDGSRALLKGIWPTRAAASLGACAAAARIWGLDPAQTQDALVLALTMSSGRGLPFARVPSGRWILFANAVETGIRAAMAGRAGFSGGSKPLTSEWMSGALGTAFDDKLLTDGLGRGSIYPELSMKPYATSRQTLSAADAMLALVREGLDVSTIRRITIRVPKAHAGLVSAPIEQGLRTRNFMSAALQVSVAAMRPGELFNAEREGLVRDPDVLCLAQLCDLVGDEQLDAVFPAVWGARLDVETTEGALSRTVMQPLGAPNNRMNDRQLAAKAAKVLGHCGLADKADEIIARGEAVFEERRAAEWLGRMILEG